MLIITRTGCLARRSLNCLQTRRTCRIFFILLSFFYYTIMSLLYRFVSIYIRLIKRKRARCARDSLRFKAESREGQISNRKFRHNENLTDRTTISFQFMSSKYILVISYRKKRKVKKVIMEKKRQNSIKKKKEK